MIKLKKIFKNYTVKISIIIIIGLIIAIIIVVSLKNVFSSTMLNPVIPGERFHVYQGAFIIIKDNEVIIKLSSLKIENTNLTLENKKLAITKGKIVVNNFESDLISGPLLEKNGINFETNFFPEIGKFNIKEDSDKKKIICQRQDKAEWKYSIPTFEFPLSW